VAGILKKSVSLPKIGGRKKQTTNPVVVGCLGRIQPNWNKGAKSKPKKKEKKADRGRSAYIGSSDRKHPKKSPNFNSVRVKSCGALEKKSF